MKVLITGGSRGFGKSLALGMERRGHDVTVTWNRTAPAGIPASVRAVRCDVSDRRQVESLARYLASSGTGVDAWINNAAASMDGFSDTGPNDEAWMKSAEEVMLTNVQGLVYGVNGALETGARHVFNVFGAGCDYNHSHVKGYAIYASTKCFGAFYTRAVRMTEPRVHGIVTGPMKTGMLDKVLARCDPVAGSVLRALSVDPDAAAGIAAREIESAVARDSPGRTINCYPRALARTAMERMRPQGRSRKI